MNIDIMEECPVPGMPYMKGDIRKLPFEDNTADLIFTCHVIEHFWPWDLQEILKEWKRVLKPGGLLVTECPNVHGAAQILMAAMEKQDNKLYTAAMFALYGDPRPEFRHIEQRHKWGYTPHTLCNILEEAGYVKARQEPAQFKMREPRDMRVVAEK